MHPSTAFAATTPRRGGRARHRRVPSARPFALVALLAGLACAAVLGSVSFAVGGA